MPDHVHLILQKLKRTSYHLEYYIEQLKKMIVDRYNAETGQNLMIQDIFQDLFTDKLLFRRVNLQHWITYVSHNPYRRAMVTQHPDFFRRIRNLKIGDENYAAYGNLFLFRNPDKFQVRVRRHFSMREIDAHFQEAMFAAKNGSVLVSPFISRFEKIIRFKAEETGAKIILVRDEEFGEKFKPSKHDFELCEQGRLLIISLGCPRNSKITYNIATRMNELASLIAGTRFAE